MLTHLERKFVRFCLAWCAVLPGIPVHSDEILLKDGKTFTDVRVTEERGAVYVISRDGSFAHYNRADVKEITAGPVNWTQPTANEELALLKNRLAAAEEEFRARAAIGRWGAVWRSMLFPGWGHFRSGHDNWGAAYMSVTLGLIGYLAAKEPEFQRMKKTYTTQKGGLGFSVVMIYSYSSPNQTYINPAFNLMPLLTFTYLQSRHFLTNFEQKQQKNRNRTIAALGAVYLLQVLHAGLWTPAGSASKAARVEESRFQFALIPVPGGAECVLAVRF